MYRQKYFQLYYSNDTVRSKEAKINVRGTDPLVEIGQVVLVRKIYFFKSSIYFHYFVIISPWKREGSFILKTCNPFIQGWFVLSLVEIGAVVLEEKFFLISSMYFLQFLNYLILAKGGSHYLNKLESPTPNDVMCQVWLKLD